MPQELSTTLQGQINRLILEDLKDQLPGQPIELWRFDPEIEEFFPDAGAKLTADEIMELISTASLLALSEESPDRTLAYEIVTRAIRVTNGKSRAVLSAAEIILARLGNFPGRELLRQRYGSQQSTGGSSVLALEVLAREIDNTVEMPSGKERALTDFQHDLFAELSEWPSASVSAPTSSGKSFVLALDIARRMRERKSSIVYVVPTRALIRQVMVKVIEVLDSEGLQTVPVRCVPLALDQAHAPHGIVYVLTQERLISLLMSEDPQPWITTLIVDEAQGVGDGARGVTLHTATDTVVDRFPDAEVYFASPVANNPEYLLEIFRRTHAAPPLVEEHSPVSQNIILVRPKKGEPTRIDCSVIVNGSSTYLGEWQLPFTFGGEKLLVRRARMAVAVTRKGESTLVYANAPAQAREVAREIVNALDGSTYDIDPAVEDLIHFIEKFIHPEYELIKTLRAGVGFHYGEMPSVVRAAVEDLFSEGKLQYVCCTSTLLQGVNLPAKHIVIENPSRGQGNRMGRRDFLNLSGRAGRLLKEFHGSVWCLCPDLWDVKSYQGESLQLITSSFEETMADGGTLIAKVLDGTVTKDDDEELGIAALGKVFSEFTQNGRSLENSIHRTSENLEQLRRTAAKCSAIKVDLPPIVFRRNATINPVRLQALYDFLHDHPDLLQLIPLHPNQEGSQVRLKTIFEILERVLEDNPGEGYSFHSWLAGRWIRETPLRAIIDERLQWLTDNALDAEPTETIANIMKAIETDLRFRYTRNIRAYIDVIAFALRENGKRDLADHISPMHLYLECGAADGLVLSLIAIGVSRTTAILLGDLRLFSRSATPEVCQSVLRLYAIRNLPLPEICRRELEALRRASR